jgi:hypothetical protein
MANTAPQNRIILKEFEGQVIFLLKEKSEMQSREQWLDNETLCAIVQRSKELIGMYIVILSQRPQEALEHSIPFRLWTYGIFLPFNILRRQQPYDHERMVHFILYGQSTINRLYNTIPGFINGWKNMLGDCTTLLLSNHRVRP